MKSYKELQKLGFMLKIYVIWHAIRLLDYSTISKECIVDLGKTKLISTNTLAIAQGRVTLYIS